ncbi:MAG: restriction endonuclease subunit S [Phycisphaerales bacterium]
MPIGDGVCDIETWSQIASDTDFEFEYIDIASIDREQKAIITTTRTRTPDAPSRARQIVQKGDVLVSTVRPGLNAVATVPESLDGAIASTGFTVLRCDERHLHGPYLFHWVRSTAFVDEMVRLATGASYPAVSDRIVKNSSIPIPFPDDLRRSLAEQKRIAAILNKADAIRRRRQEAARLADTLVPSLFYEMFGDPDANSKKLPTTTIGELSRVLTGATPSRLVADNFGGSIPWVKTTEVTNGVIRSTEECITEQGMESSRCELYPVGSLVIALYGQGATRGRVSLLGISAAANQACAIIPPAKTFVTSFLWTQLKMSYLRLRGEARGGNQPNLNLQIVRAFEVLNPPLERQKEFDRRFQRHAALLGTHEASGRQGDDLFNALVQRAFRGEL